LPNLRRLKVNKFRNVDPRLMQQFEKLSSLTVSSHTCALKFIPFIGAQLKELRISPTSLFVEDFLANIFNVCPNLESLELIRFSSHLNFQALSAPENLKLKKLHLTGNFSESTEFLNLLLRAAQLLEVKLEFSTKVDLGDLAASLSVGEIFQNMTRFELKCFGSRNTWKEEMAVFENVAKSVISFCPRLQTARFIFYGSDSEKNYEIVTNTSVIPFIKLLKEI